jgi:hypothetical protein
MATDAAFVMANYSEPYALSCGPDSRRRPMLVSVRVERGGGRHDDELHDRLRGKHVADHRRLEAQAHARNAAGASPRPSRSVSTGVGATQAVFLTNPIGTGSHYPTRQKPCDRTRRFANVSGVERPAGSSIEAA